MIIKRYLKNNIVYNYSGHHIYSVSVIEGWDSTAIGVYYCGYISPNGLIPLYIGKGAGVGGMRSRLLDHLQNDYWPDVTHFGFYTCDTEPEAIALETQHIKQFQPKYNIQGK